MNKLHLLLNRKNILFTFIVIAVIGIVINGFLIIKYQKAQSIVKNLGFAGQEEAQDLTKKVSRFILLPENEVPTIATVSDYTKLKDQPFFEKSLNGDKVLIYPKAKKAYLYRPATDKLIDVTIINVNSGATQQPVVVSPTPKPSK